jgi:predicted lipid-binding transport protein (Tim44 family)
MSGSAAVNRILSKAQAELRSLLEQALAESRYTDVAEIAKVADGLAQLVVGNSRSSSAAEPAASRSPLAEAVPVSHIRPARPSRRTYPRFEREADKLVKIAWSKKDRAEYEHKAPRQVADLLVEAIRNRKGEGAKFEAPEVLPLKDSKTRREIPSYQSYLTLAWLRHEGVITKYGRDGYALKPTTAQKEHIAELWEALPSRD